MSTNTEYPHLTIDENSQVRIGKTRYKVIHLATEHYGYGWTAEELLCQHPDLRPEEVYAALTYFYDHHDAMVAEMKASLAAAENNRPPQTFTRDELLSRQTAQGE
ncbi:MAG: DUF433 domain-containing protein [Planctomycetota bacterium]|nr:DUF433 domain-containing protein [Planctomycetota bacterium]